MPSLPWHDDDGHLADPLFEYWRRALPIMRAHYPQFKRNSDHSTCVGCGVAYPCDTRLLAEVLIDTTEKLVITNHHAYHQQGG